MWPFSQLSKLRHDIEELRFFASQRIAELAKENAELKNDLVRLQGVPDDIKKRVVRLEENKEACMAGIRRLNEITEDHGQRVALLSADVCDAISYYEKVVTEKKKAVKKK